MKAEELKTKTKDELTKILLDLKKEQFNLRLQKVQGQLENPIRMRGLRRDIARVRTYLGATAPKTVTKAAAKTKAAPAKAAKSKKSAA